MKNFDELYKDIHTCRKLLKLFHPDCPDVPDVTMRKICGPGNYDWQQICGMVKGIGYVHLCIDNGHDTTMTIGPSWTVKDFEKKVKAGALTFNMWRITNDSKYIPSDYKTPGVYEKEKADKLIMRDKYIAILKEAGYRTKTAHEWYKEYFKD